jgi:hypothetical protein
MANIYQEQGYKSRKDYLESLSDDLGVDRDTVFELANLLGPSEDFDGLVTALEDVGGEA